MILRLVNFIVISLQYTYTTTGTQQVAKVFTDEYIQDIKRRYGHKPDYDKPDIYRIAVSNIGQSRRDEIEALLADLPYNDSQKDIIEKLKSDKISAHTEAYNELSVGYLLKQVGYQVEHGKEFQIEHKKLTPDWYVHPKGDTPTFIVEVFTTNYYGNERREEDVQIKNLERRLREIPVDAGLSIRLDEGKVLESECNKRIAQEIKQWLLQKDLPVGVQYSGIDFTCEIVERNTGFPEVDPTVFREVVLGDTERLQKNIREKTKRYRNLGMPLVVAIVTDPIIGIHLRSVLLGTKRVRFSYNKFTGARITEHIQLNNGLFGKKPDLSAVLWISTSLRGWKMTAIYNPTATKPLPGDTFGETHCSVSPLGD